MNRLVQTSNIHQSFKTHKYKKRFIKERNHITVHTEEALNKTQETRSI